MKRFAIIIFLFCLILLSLGLISKEYWEEDTLVEIFKITNAELESIKVDIILKETLDNVKQKKILHKLMSQEHLKLSYSESNSTAVLSISLREEENLKNLTDQLMHLPIKDKFISIRGLYDGKKSNIEMENIAYNLIESIGGKVLEFGYIQDDFFFTSAYTEKLRKSIITGGDKINLNIALKYNNYKDETTIIIGTPLIYGEY